MDWLSYGYAAAIFFGGFMGYKRKGSVMSLIAGLVFGGVSAYGAYNVSNDPKDVLVLLASSGLLAVIMGMRYKKSGEINAGRNYVGAKFADGVSPVAPDHGVTDRAALTNL